MYYKHRFLVALADYNFIRPKSGSMKPVSTLVFRHAAEPVLNISIATYFSYQDFMQPYICMYHTMYTTEYIRVYVCTYACMQIVELQNQVAAWIGANDCQELSMTIMFPV